MKPLTIIVAATASNGIGKNGALPWRLPQEMKYFSKVTSKAPEGKINAVLMGRKTWESIPKKYRPLSGRWNIVISRNANYTLGVDDVELQGGLPAAVEAISESKKHQVHRSFIIGGVGLYDEGLLNQAVETGMVDRILMTRIISPEYDDCDVFFPEIRGVQGGKGGHWIQSSHNDLQDWVGFEVPKGTQVEGEAEYEFQMWTRTMG